MSSKVVLQARSITPRMVSHHISGAGDKAIFEEVQNGWIIHLDNNAAIVVAEAPEFPFTIVIGAPNEPTN